MAIQAIFIKLLDYRQVTATIIININKIFK